MNWNKIRVRFSLDIYFHDMVTFCFLLRRLSRVLLPRIFVRGVATASILDLLTSITSPLPLLISRNLGEHLCSI